MMNEQLKCLLNQIEAEVRLTQGMTGRSALDPRVMSAIAATPRDKFVPEIYLDSAYDNAPLPIGYGQTISQPYIVALMTDLLELEEDAKVLEIGTGSGYQAAILSSLCDQVYTIEYVPELAEVANARFKELGYDNIKCIAGNGYDGWPEYAPFDGIIVTAAATHIPEALIEQLKTGGRMVIPVGAQNRYQELTLIEKDENGELGIRGVLGVAFVPFQGEHG